MDSLRTNNNISFPPYGLDTFIFDVHCDPSKVSFVDFLITLAITLILGVIFVICADRLYLSAARESKVSSAGKKKKVSYRNQGSAASV